MSILSVRELTQGFGEKTLYKDAAFELQKSEHIGVIGQNGVGKSTLLEILLGETVPDSGIIQWRRGVSVAHMDQHAKVERGVSVAAYLRSAYADLYEKERVMAAAYEECTGDAIERAGRIQEELLAADFYGIDTEVSRVMTGLGLTAFGSDTPLDRLSGGQRTKVMLGKLLLDRADVLLLDEPTNFLDAAHIDWFAAYLTAYPGAFMIVSHDVAFLERIAAGILDIEFGAIRKYSCGYKAFLRQKAHLREDYIRQYNAQRREIERTEAFIRKNIAGQNTRIAQGRRTRLERMERLEKSGYAQKPNFRFSCKDVPAGTMLKVRNLEIGYHYPLLPGFGFSVESGQKLVITGFNGIGKSTLLKTLTGVIPALSGAFILHPMAKTGYYEQDLLWPNPDAAPLDIIAAAFPMINRKEARKALAQCGVKDEHVRQPVGTLSGGEQSKVKLCGLVLKKSNFLILDEPTNHLDAETKDTLKQALTEFRGSVILVTHEEQFYRGWADKVLNIG